MSFFGRSVLQFFGKYSGLLLATVVAAVVAPVVLVVICYYVVQPYKKFVVDTANTPHVSVGLVLGAGITKSGEPYKELQARLDSGAEALKAGAVSKLVLSGDNRFAYYDEPTAMFNYLTQKKHIPASKLQRDYAGRSTYESCERAAKIFGLKETVIFSAGSHLPRAVYLCRSFGIEAYGISSGAEGNNSTRRELLARVKAVYNVNFIGERTILGNAIPVQ